MTNRQIRDAYNKISLSPQSAEEIWLRAMESAEAKPQEKGPGLGKHRGKTLRRTILIAAVIAAFFAVTAFGIGYSIHQQRQRTNVGDTANVGQHIIKGRNTEIGQPQRTCRHATARKINCLISGTLRQQRMMSVDGANNLQWIFFSQCSAKRFTWRV